MAFISCVYPLWTEVKVKVFLSSHLYPVCSCVATKTHRRHKMLCNNPSPPPPPLMCVPLPLFMLLIMLNTHTHTHHPSSLCGGTPLAHPSCVDISCNHGYFPMWSLSQWEGLGQARHTVGFAIFPSNGMTRKMHKVAESRSERA